MKNDADKEEKRSANNNHILSLFFLSFVWLPLLQMTMLRTLYIVHSPPSNFYAFHFEV